MGEPEPEPEPTPPTPQNVIWLREYYGGKKSDTHSGPWEFEEIDSFTKEAVSKSLAPRESALSGQLKIKGLKDEIVSLMFLIEEEEKKPVSEKNQAFIDECNGGIESIKREIEKLRPSEPKKKRGVADTGSGAASGSGIAPGSSATATPIPNKKALLKHKTKKRVKKRKTKKRKYSKKYKPTKKRKKSKSN